MKNKKLNLNELKVKSFVTDFENGKENTVKGGLHVPPVASYRLGCSENVEDNTFGVWCVTNIGYPMC